VADYVETLMQAREVLVTQRRHAAAALAGFRDQPSAVPEAAEKLRAFQQQIDAVDRAIMDEQNLQGSSGRSQARFPYTTEPDDPSKGV
jgi:hypothetical protein